MNILLEKINNYVQEDVMIFCKIGKVVCYLFKENKITYITLEGNIVSHKKIEDLDEKVIKQLHKYLFD